MNEYSRFQDEPILDYELRICSKKKEIGTWDDVADILNKELNQSFTESKYRKMFHNSERMSCNMSTKAVAEKLMEDFKIVSGRDRTKSDNIRILTISDLHIPYNDPIKILEPYFNNVDILQINGDIVDCQSLSKFPKIYRKSPIDEIVEAHYILQEIIMKINPKKVVVNIGNHDIRFQNYLAHNLDTDILELMPMTSAELLFVDGFTRYDKETKDKYKYQPLCAMFKDTEFVFNNTWYSKIGDCIFCHPYCFSSGILSTAEKARRYFKDEGISFKYLIMAHTHRIGYYYIGDTRIYEQGAFCDTSKMNYGDGKLQRSQKQGFMYLEQDTNGNTIRESVKQIELN